MLSDGVRSQLTSFDSSLEDTTKSKQAHSETREQMRFVVSIGERMREERTT